MQRLPDPVPLQKLSKYSTNASPNERFDTFVYHLRANSCASAASSRNDIRRDLVVYNILRGLVLQSIDVRTSESCKSSCSVTTSGLTPISSAIPSTVLKAQHSSARASLIRSHNAVRSTCWSFGIANSSFIALRSIVPIDDQINHCHSRARSILNISDLMPTCNGFS